MPRSQVSRAPFAVLACAAAAFLFARALPGGAAAEPPAIRIGTVNLTKLADGYVRGQQKHREAEKAIDEINQRFRAEEERLEKMDRELALLKPESEEYERRRKALRMEVAGYQEERRAGQEKRDRIGFEHMRARYAEMREALEFVAKRAGVTLVVRAEPPDPADENMDRFESSVQVRDVLWSVEGLDLTQQVVDRLNEIYPPIPGMELPKPGSETGAPKPPETPRAPDLPPPSGEGGGHPVVPPAEGR